MRIISQDEMIDVPYEQISLELRENEIWCAYSMTLQRYCAGKLFAKYSTEAKARKAMEMLREAYCGIAHVGQKFIDGKVKDIADAIRNGFIPPMTINVPKDECKLFKFPADDEVKEQDV